MNKRGGIPTLLATFKCMLGNPLARTLLRLATKRVKCYYIDYENVVDSSLLHHTLAIYSGLRVQCPLSMRFLSTAIGTLIKTGIKIMKGNDDEVREAFRDPAVRRGVALVLRGIALYGITVPQKLPAPFLIVWNFTNMCNFKCKHCYQNANKTLPTELSLHEKLEIIEELDRAGVASIALSGGEPTIHPDFLTVVKAAASKGIYVAVATNGWKFAELSFLKKAVNAGLRYIEVSIDSSNPRRHDKFRGVEGSWLRAVKALENAVKLGVSTAMAVTLTKYNVDEIDDILDLAESIGVKRIVFFNFIPVGRGKEIIDQDLDPMTREKVLRKLFKESRRRGLEVISTAPQYGRISIQCSGGKVVAPTHFTVRGDPIVTALAEFIGGCGAGRIYCAIQPDGLVTPCVFMPIVVGNLRKESFWSIWSKSPLLLKLRNRNLLKGSCNVCPFKNVCGGCRARAYAYFKDPLAPDPGCIYNLRFWREVCKNIETKEQAII